MLMIRKKHPSPPKAASPPSPSPAPSPTFFSAIDCQDARRIVAVAIDSMLISGPALHVLYGLMEHIIPTNSGGFMPATAHVLLDTLVFDPVFVASFFCVTGMLENRPLRGDVLPALRR